MSRLMRLFYYGVLGAIGGVIGWQLSNILGLSFVGNVYISEIFVGALIGLSIGLLIGLAEGVLTRNFVQAGKAALIGGAAGLAAGAIALPLTKTRRKKVWGSVTECGISVPEPGVSYPNVSFREVPFDFLPAHL